MENSAADVVNQDFLKLPYRDRQIVVTVKENYDFHLRVRLKLSDYYSSEVFEANAKLSNWLKPSHWKNPKTWGLYGYLYDRVRGHAEDSGQHISYFRKLPAGLAEKQLSLPPGHPLYDTVYAGHPLKAKVYVPIANFHQYLFQEKFNELLKLFWCLGAKRVGISYVTGYKRELEASIAMELPVDIPVELKVGGKQIKSTEAKADVEAHFQPTDTPKVPNDLIWFAHEPTWRQIAEARLTGGLKKIDIALRYEDDFGVSGNVSLGMEKMGFKLGGKFYEHEKTAWNFHGSF